MRRYLAATCWLSVFLLLGARPANAECITRNASDVLQDPRAELVFSGTVTTITRTAEFGYRATVAVDRVWKGTVPNLFDLYVYEGTPEGMRLSERQHRIVVAQRIADSRTRAAVGLAADPGVAFMPTPCNAGLTEGWDRIDQLGRPRLPDAVTPLPKHDDWVTIVSRQMKAIQPGMTRGDLLKVFIKREGGLSVLGNRKATFLNRTCQNFQVEVEFAPGATGSDSDVIVAISRPYVEDGVAID